MCSLRLKRVRVRGIVIQYSLICCSNKSFVWSVFFFLEGGEQIVAVEMRLSCNPQLEATVELGAAYPSSALRLGPRDPRQTVRWRITFPSESAPAKQFVPRQFFSMQLH